MEFSIRTDLALEKQESFEKDHVEIHGVLVEKTENKEKEIETTIVKIETENGAKAMKKPQGTYITIEAVNLSIPDEDYHREISEELALHIKTLLPRNGEPKVLVVGLGNRMVTPDALGPFVVDNLRINRHIVREYGRSSIPEKHISLVSALIPGVMAQTGMESLEIISGVVKETQPDVIIAIDALAARSLKRLSRTIQITDTGISPGSGVGNHRNGINEENLHIPVIGIGIPTVVDAATIVYDSMSHLLESLLENDKEEFLNETISPNLHTMFVTPKDVDETVKRLAYTISEGINLALKEI